MNSLHDYKVGDVLEITCRSLRGEEVRAAEVVYVNQNGNGLVGIVGAYRKGMLPTGQGAFDPTSVGTKPYGLYCDVKVVGYAAPRPIYQPQPRRPFQFARPRARRYA